MALKYFGTSVPREGKKAVQLSHAMRMLREAAKTLSNRISKPQSEPHSQEQSDPSTWFAQAISLHNQGQLAQAKRIYERILARQPTHFDAMHLLGVIAAQSQDFLLAVKLIAKAIEVDPNQEEAHSNRGIALQELNRFEEAIASYDRAIALKPDYAEAFYNRGNALNRLKRFEEAIASYDRAMALKPGYAEACSNRGIALQESGQIDEAIASYDCAIALKPDYAEAWSNRGIALQESRRIEEALASYDRAIALKRDHAEAYVNKASCLLLSGNFKQGWALYEWRWKIAKASMKPRDHDRPLWLGQLPIAGKSILLHAEQGLGDTLQFCRYAKLVKAQGARVLLQVPAPLASLLRSLEGVDDLITSGERLPPFDYHCPLLSLPLAFDTELTNIPSPARYLAVSSSKHDEWANRLGKKRRLRAGVVWSGSTMNSNDRNRSLGLRELLPYLPDGIDYVSLQKEVRESDRELLSASRVAHYGGELKDFSDTAALCDLMDVVISVDTSVAHLAGALGKRTWVLLRHAPAWRWLLDREDSPWYDSVRLFRQPQGGEWNPVLQRIQQHLLGLAKSDDAQPDR